MRSPLIEIFFTVPLVRLDSLPLGGRDVTVGGIFQRLYEYRR
jgi:hypothetical protein